MSEEKLNIGAFSRYHKDYNEQVEKVKQAQDRFFSKYSDNKITKEKYSEKEAEKLGQKMIEDFENIVMSERNKLQDLNKIDLRSILTYGKENKND